MKVVNMGNPDLGFISRVWQKTKLCSMVKPHYLSSHNLESERDLVESSFYSFFRKSNLTAIKRRLLRSWRKKAK